MSEKIKEVVEAFHDNHVCIPTKTLKIFGDIDEEIKDRTISNLHLLDQVTGEITILLSSGGGSVNEGLAIVDAIRAAKNFVRIICYGEVASMATVILQAADTGRRYMTPNSYLMLHEGEGGQTGKARDRKAWQRIEDWQEKTCIDMYWNKIIEKKPHSDRKKFEKKVNDSDWLLTPEEAIEQGLADTIIGEY
jgi:ATP-dependent Clp protease protease subunit